ncbi:phosphopantetheine-binding protein [Rathayibacter tanaceti]|uniref:Chondramide synthase cmdD n=1 Tax=Rathayibacter tanaceti TaxID=1671680 RepID=A0A162GE90_9MICO|nr:Chondramide synthase cmdD [Rathayibacter tanaceti]
MRAHAAGVVPVALVPSRLTAVPALPLTPHGKLDRAALPALDRLPVAAEGRAPASATEVAVAEAFAAALGVASVPADADFFALGGDSISAIAVVTAAQRAGIRMSVIDLFETRTVEALAVRCAPAAAPAAGRPVPLPALLAAARADGTDVDAMSVSVPLGTPAPSRRAVPSSRSSRPVPSCVCALTGAAPGSGGRSSSTTSRPEKGSA